MPTEPAARSPELPETTHTLSVGESSYTLRILGDPRAPIRYVVLHGNEETAARAVVDHLQRHDGCLIQLVNPGERLVRFRFRRRRYDFDPNRIFTRAGIERNLKLLNRRFRRSRPLRQRQTLEQVKQFADALLKLLVEPRVPGQGIIAVHNNGTNPRANFSFETFVEPTGYFQGVEAMYYQRRHSPYNLFVVTNPQDFNELMGRDLNVVLENGERAADDGSLSVYFGREKIRYANIETRLGELENQVEMLETLRSIWDFSPKLERGPTPREP